MVNLAIQKLMGAPLADDSAQYDVAISFLARDQEIAQALYDNLAGLNVFFFPRSQEELAGSNGMESMRKPFMEARTVVVLFRDPWGKTPWTRVEDTAIQERCLKRGWQGLIFVQLDKSHAHPTWVPNTHVRYNVEDFGLEGLSGVVKARIVDSGGEIKRLDATAVAQQARREADYSADRSTLMRDPSWIFKLRESISRSLVDAAGLAHKLGEANQMAVVAGAENLYCVMRCQQWITVHCHWPQSYTNSVMDDNLGETFLSVKELSGGVATPGEPIGFAFQPTLIREHKFKIDIDRSRHPIWRETGASGLIAPEQLADRIVQIFFDLIHTKGSNI